MSHEIRTPLNGMLGMIDLTLLSSLTKEQKDNLYIAKDCAYTLLNLINDILDFSKIEARKLTLENINFNFRSFISQSMKSHALRIQEKGLDFQYEIDSKISYGECDITVDGLEALEAFMIAHDEGEPYDLICLDIMMPNLDGEKTLKVIRDIERQKGIEDFNRVKVIMTTALNDTDRVFNAFDTGCEAYASKPINTEKLVEVIKKLGLIQ